MNRAHATPKSRRQDPLYDTDVATPSHAERARTLVASRRTGTLATLAREPEGHPYASFVTFALDDAGRPVFLVSELAEHTRNLRGDARASLLVAEDTHEDPLANGRVTLLGACGPVDDDPTDEPSARDAFLAAHPNAAYYADFRDFAFWRLEVESLRYIGGYGRMSWVDADDWRAARPDPLAPHAERIVQHMNDDHRDAMALLCRAFSRATDFESVAMTGVDRYGYEMSVTTAEGPRPVRLAFPDEVTTPDAARKALVAMVGEARATLA